MRGNDTGDELVEQEAQGRIAAGLQPQGAGFEPGLGVGPPRMRLVVAPQGLQSRRDPCVITAPGEMRKGAERRRLVIPVEPREKGVDAGARRFGA
jgi:hypothetical protein